MASEETLELVVDRFLRPMPSLIFHQRTTPHVHSQILLGGSHVTPTPARSDLEPQASLEPSVLKRTHQQLVYLDINSLSLTEFLAAFHGLVAILLATILSLNHQSRNPSPPTDLLDLWSKWRQQLSVKLPRELDSNLSAWQAWYMAETARRSLLCVILIDGILEVVEKGYCSYRPMVESMPFDARTGLWEADTEQDWLTALSQHGGEESSLISWAEFIEAGDIEPRPKYDGMLQRMLLAIHYGKAAADLQDTKNCAS
ncbi:hypothetical protein H2200_011431 [Cladophialophora chaetospira]|uniref:Transcription factor domain-containing protein n=1 Tax=Cladophialophora chaetospira TaxID=386627 RepID=A0AA38WZC1_9EURO|nr:hypothetical protein H2200_011431 [Cladophialophora chaetospira]